MALLKKVEGLEKKIKFPYLLLLISGGHTQFLIVKDINKYEQLGTTIDDALGEAFDKTAKMLGLGYTGGPNVEKFAKFGVAELISIEGGAVVKSNYEENGYLNFSSGYLTMSESKLEAGKSIKIKTLNKSAFSDKSTLSVGWESAEVNFDGRPKAYWDAKQVIYLMNLISFTL